MQCTDIPASIVMFSPDHISINDGVQTTTYIVKSLANCLQYMELVTDWYDDDWGYLRPDRPDYSKELYRKQLNINKLPIAYLIFKKEIPIGIFSLLPNTFNIGNPSLIMLNGVYLSKPQRGTGIGKDIVRIAEYIAKNKFGLSTLQLGTMELWSREFYKNLGWKFTLIDKLEDMHPVYMLEKNI